MLCIIQSRMNSARLPGKALMDICGKPLLGRVIDRVKSAEKVTKVIVATSVKVDDNSIEDYCKKTDTECFRGNLNNVANRLLQLVLNEEVDSFVRVSGDSPLIPPSIIDSAINHFKNNDYDLVTNIYPRSYPKGFSVEVMSTESFLKMNKEDLTQEHKEHVTKKYYETPNKYKIFNFMSPKNYSQFNFCIDTIDDLDKMNSFFVSEKDNHDDWEKLCNIYK